MLKIGDKVRVKSYEELKNIALDINVGKGDLVFKNDVFIYEYMAKFCEKEFIILDCNEERKYYIEKEQWAFTDEMLEKVD